MLPLIGDLLHTLADYKIKIHDYETLNHRGIKSCDKNFKIDLIANKVIISSEGFKIQLGYDEYNCDKQDISCDSLEVSKILKNNLDKILKKIRINISDCPKWMQDELKHINQKELKRREDRNKIKKIFKR